MTENNQQLFDSFITDPATAKYYILEWSGGKKYYLTCFGNHQPIAEIEKMNDPEFPAVEIVSCTQVFQPIFEEPA